MDSGVFGRTSEYFGWGFGEPPIRSYLIILDGLVLRVVDDSNPSHLHGYWLQ